VSKLCSCKAAIDRQNESGKSEQNWVNILTLFYIGMDMFVLYMFGKDELCICLFLHSQFECRLMTLGDYTR
jgi:hypothetical protein